MFHPSLMHDLLAEAREKKAKSKVAVQRIAQAKTKYKEIKEIHIDLVTRTLKNER